MTQQVLILVGWSHITSHRSVEGNLTTSQSKHNTNGKQQTAQGETLVQQQVVSAPQTSVQGQTRETDAWDDKAVPFMMSLQEADRLIR